MQYIILNDGETYTSLKGCVIFDDVYGKLYSIRKRREIDTTKTLNNMHWEKGIDNIMNNENTEYLQPNINEDDGILGK